MHASDPGCQSKILEFLPESFQVGLVSFHADAAIDHDELSYLFDLRDGDQGSAKSVFNGLFYLQQSLKFSDIQFTIQLQGQKYDFFFDLKKNEMLHRVLVVGFARGKEQLKNHYLIDLGDVFSQAKHQHSLDAMINFLRDRGYFKACIKDTVSIDPKTKQVFVRCRVCKGSKFKIQSVILHFSKTGNLSDSERVKIEKELQSVYFSKLVNRWYAAWYVDDLVKKMKRYLQHKGCIDFDISINQQMHDDEKSMDIIVDLAIAKKREFVFEGLRFFSQETILDHLLLYGKSTWHFPSALIVDEIKDLYKSKGFWNVTVGIKEQKEQVLCSIDQGARVLIGDVVCKGNTFFSQDWFKKHIFQHVLRLKYFDRDRVKQACECLMKCYKQAGFWDVKIIKEEYGKTSKASVCQLQVAIDEGVRKFFNSVSVMGFESLQKELKSFCATRERKGFDPNWLSEQKQFILRYLRSKGYQKVDAEYILNDYDGAVDVTWSIQCQDAALRVGKTVFIGNSTVPHRLLMGEITQQAGDGWDKKLLESSLQNLKALPIFESVQIYPGSKLDSELCKPIFVKLIEQDRYLVKTRIGIQQVGRNLQPLKGCTYKLGATFGLNNPFNFADKLLIEGDVTRFYRDVRASYQFPWIAGKKIGSEFKIYDSAYFQPVYIGSQDSLYNATQQGFLFNVNRNYDWKSAGQCLINGAAGLEFMGLFQAEQPDLPIIIDYDKNLLGKRIGYLFAESSLFWQRTDAMLSPHAGSIAFLSCKAMFDLDSKTSFAKVLAEFTQYIPCMDRVTLALRARAGHVFNRYFNQLNPIERFYLGGAYTVRGYERDYCPPLGLLTKPIYDQHAGLPSCSNDLWRYAPQGGRTMLNFNVDLRLNVYKNFGVVLFSDFGALFKDSLYDQAKTWKEHFFAGSGVGIRYDTPIGPIRFDVGYKWKIEHPDFESRCVWYLTLGHAF